jgi:hypothetical protein
VDKDVQLSLFYNFPELSIIFKKVRIYEPDTSVKTPFSTINKIALSFNLIDVWKGNYTISRLSLQDGNVYLKTNASGEHNFTIIKDDSTSDSKDFSIESIFLKNIDFRYDLENKNQHYAFYIYNNTAQLSFENDRYDIHSMGDLVSKEITLDSISYLLDKNIQSITHLTYHTDKELFEIHPSELKIEKGSYTIQGSVDNRLSTLDLNFKGNKNELQTITSLLPKQYATSINQYHINGSIYFEGSIKGVLSDKAVPSIRFQFGMDNATVQHPSLKGQIKNASFKGSYSNGSKQHPSTSSILIQNISASFDNEKINGFFEYSNFVDPSIRFELKGILHFSWISLFLPNETFKSSSGNLHVNILGDGRLKDLEKVSTFDRFNSQGDISFQDIRLDLTHYPNPIRIESGDCTFNKNDVAASDVQLEIGHSKMKLNGLFKNLIGKIIHPERPMYIQADLVAENIYANELLFSEERNKSNSNENFLLPSFKEYKVEIDLKAKTIEYQKFKASSISSKIKWSYPYLEFSESNMLFCGGKYSGNNTVKVISEKLLEIKSDSKIEKMFIDSLFYVFDNFSQDFITQKHLKGQISSDISLIFQLDNQLNIASSSLVCDADITIQNGELIQFEPLIKIQKFVDGSQINHVKFSELKNHILIFNETVQLPEMKIKSNIGEMSISGTHTFNNQINYYIGYPMKNIKKEKLDPDATFGAIRPSDKGEMTLFLIIKGTTDDFSITYDTKKVKEKILTDIKKEKEELIQIFKKKEIDKTTTQQTQQQENPEYFDFD